MDYNRFEGPSDWEARARAKSKKDVIEPLKNHPRYINERSVFIAKFKAAVEEIEKLRSTVGHLEEELKAQQTVNAEIMDSLHFQEGRVSIAIDRAKAHEETLLANDQQIRDYEEDLEHMHRSLDRAWEDNKEWENIFSELSQKYYELEEEHNNLKESNNNNNNNNNKVIIDLAVAWDKITITALTEELKKYKDENARLRNANAV